MTSWTPGDPADPANPANQPPSYGQHEFAQSDRTNRWLTIASGEAGVDAPIALRQDASVRVARLENAELDVALRAGRFGFLFVADGAVSVNGEQLTAGDAVRAAGEQRFAVRGSAEIVFWDVPPTNIRLEDA